MDYGTVNSQSLPEILHSIKSTQDENVQIHAAERYRWSFLKLNILCWQDCQCLPAYNVISVYISKKDGQVNKHSYIILNTNVLQYRSTV